MKWRNEWKAAEQAYFLKRIGELLTRGYSLAEAIHSIASYIEKARKEQLAKVIADLNEGYSFHQALSELGFKRVLVSYVYFAEQHGDLAEALKDGSQMVMKRLEDFRRLQRLAAYPLFLAALTFVLFFFVDKTLLPKFTSLYDSMDVEQAKFTRIIYFLGDLLPVIFYGLVVCLIAFVLYFRLYFVKLPSIQQRKKLVRIPVAGKILKLLYTQSFSTQLSYLFSGGLSVYEVMEIFRKDKTESFSAEVGIAIEQMLTDGKEFSTSLSEFPFLEEELCRVVKLGQENGRLGQELFFYSRHCLAIIEERTEKGMRVIQPVLYSFIGLLIISLYLAILLPMFKLIEGI
ncbi:competence type IV pilus assembly protein ComGB [Bacillus massilinigeriensis]|uniref:competence type IV pilus assembly protein ComGB n=1 Tax=Bacillus mediterraneensis TaxID=1805474 RepID=UPI0008F824BA|nr:competence type IV pilus assembly protein ComGB [Bacillus mediterraneensis]